MLGSQLKKPAQIRESALAMVGMALLGFAIYNNFYYPKEKEVKKIEVEVKEIQDKAAGIKKLNTALQKKYALQQLELNREAQRMMVTDPRIQMLKDSKYSVYKDVSAFLEAITKPEFRSQLDIERVSYEMPVRKKGYNEVRFFVNANGRFASVVDYLNKLEEVPTLVSLDVLNLQTHPKDTNKVTLNITGTFYEIGPSS